MTAPVSPAPIWDVVNGHAAYAALVAALDLGLVDAVLAADADGVDAARLAERIGAADPDHVAVLADLLVSLGLLGADGPRYVATPAARRFLDPQSPQQMRDLVRLSPGPAAAWTGLADTVRTGTSAVRVDDDPTTFLAPLVAATAPTQRAVAAGVAAHLGDRGLLPDDALVVDLGAGSAAWSATLLAHRPDATALAVDLPGVVDTTRRLTADLGDRIAIVAGDYLDVDLPDRADVVVLGHVLRSEPPARARALLHRAIALADADGTVVVADYPRPAPASEGDEDRAGVLAGARHELTLSLTMLAATGGHGVTVEEIQTWAGEVGAAVVTRLEPLPRQHVLLIRAAVPTDPEDPRPPRKAAS